jgi:hypothetical protein
MLPGISKIFSRKKTSEGEPEKNAQSSPPTDSKEKTPPPTPVNAPESNQPTPPASEQQAASDNDAPANTASPATPTAPSEPKQTLEKETAPAAQQSTPTPIVSPAPENNSPRREAVTDDTQKPLSQENKAAAVTPPLIHIGELSMADNAESKEAVAFQLMQHIGAQESPTEESKSTREYWLKLYRECYRTVNGRRRRKAKPAADKTA